MYKSLLFLATVHFMSTHLQAVETIFVPRWQDPQTQEWSILVRKGNEPLRVISDAAPTIYQASASFEQECKGLYPKECMGHSTNKEFVPSKTIRKSSRAKEQIIYFVTVPTKAAPPKELLWIPLRGAISISIKEIIPFWPEKLPTQSIPSSPIYRSTSSNMKHRPHKQQKKNPHKRSQRRFLRHLTKKRKKRLRRLRTYALRYFLNKKRTKAIHLQKLSK